MTERPDTGIRGQNHMYIGVPQGGWGDPGGVVRVQFNYFLREEGIRGAIYPTATAATATPPEQGDGRHCPQKLPLSPR
eukprot:1855093-Pyramimonas_sp.AAC.1